MRKWMTHNVFSRGSWFRHQVSRWSEPAPFNILRTWWAAQISISYQFCDGVGFLQADLLSFRKIKLFIPIPVLVQWPIWILLLLTGQSNVLPGAAQFKLLKLSKRVINVNITSLELESAQKSSRCILCSPYISDKARIDTRIAHQTSSKKPDIKDVMEWNSVCIIIPKCLAWILPVRSFRHFF